MGCRGPFQQRWPAAAGRPGHQRERLLQRAGVPGQQVGARERNLEGGPGLGKPSLAFLSAKDHGSPLEALEAVGSGFFSSSHAPPTTTVPETWKERLDGKLRSCCPCNCQTASVTCTCQQQRCSSAPLPHIQPASTHAASASARRRQHRSAIHNEPGELRVHGCGGVLDLGGGMGGWQGPRPYIPGPHPHRTRLQPVLSARDLCAACYWGPPGCFGHASCKACGTPAGSQIAWPARTPF